MNKTGLQAVWQKESYYQIAQKGSLNVAHPGIKVLQKLSRKAKNILDLGCGEGSRLHFLTTEGQQGLGIDISPMAIGMAKKAFPKLGFKVGNLQKLPFKDATFDLVYSAFVLEHLTNPQKVLEEGVRVLSGEGYLVLVAPNFGAPNRSSPPFKGSRIKKFVSGILADLGRLFFRQTTLNWQEVEPIASKKKYDVDWDTTIEPYLGTLLPYLRFLGLKIRKADSCWEEELPGVNLGQKLFKTLGQLNLYPFSRWGPHLLVVAQKSFTLQQ